ncbi:hypothetical protein [Streptomyces sp. NBC_00158]|uniref:hypothetical protein n=1 Tax=Streptomyces sp. NBC_00158 TaxID=2903627 RepID=UPI002F906AF1
MPGRPVPPSWERALATALADGDGTADGRERTLRARATAVAAMRDMLLRGIPAGERVNRIRRGGEGPDPRVELRHFVATHA